MPLMHSRNRSPDWRGDSKWVAAIVLVLSATVATALFSLAGLARPAAGSQVIAGILRPVLLGQEGSRIAARSDAEFSPDSPLQLLPGLDIRLDPSELPGFDAEQAQNRIAGVMTSRLRAEGRSGVLDLAGDAQLLEQLSGALAGPVRQLVSAQLGAALLGAGLADGSRLADWRTQAQNNPGAEVQPLVGVFVTADASVVEQLTAAEIGQLAVDGLAAAFLEGGEQAARELLANQTLLALYDQAVAGPLASGLHGLFRALLLGFAGEISDRLASAQQRLQASSQDGGLASGLSRGLVQDGELENLSVAEANNLLLERLAGRVQRQGPQVLDGLLAEPGQVEAAREAGPLLRRFSGQAAAGYLRLAWLATALAVLAGLVLVACSFGRGRLGNPGLALLLAGLPGLLLTDWLQGKAQVLELTAGSGGQGFIAGLTEGIRALLRAVPADLLAATRLPWLVTAGIGALLLLLVVLLWLLPVVAPRRRRF